MKKMSDDEDLLAFCGLYCGDCPGFQGKISALAKDLRKELKISKIWIYDKFAEIISRKSTSEGLKRYKVCYETLSMMVNFRCKKGCKNGGGPVFCEIRKCCQKKGINGCWECDGFEHCGLLHILNPVHGNAHMKNLRIMKKKGTTKFIDGKRYWYSEIRK